MQRCEEESAELLRTDAVRLLREQEGQPMETAPRDGTEILAAWRYLYHGDSAYTVGVSNVIWQDRGGRVGVWKDITDGSILKEDLFYAWQPLPEPPKEKPTNDR